jgi:hypothetical protein
MATITAPGRRWRIVLTILAPILGRSPRACR